MAFAYYRRLTRAQQRTYRRSDDIGSIRLPDAASLRPLVEAVAEALKAENQRKTEALSRTLVAGLT